MTATPRRILSVDPGGRRTGLAATDFTGRICLPLEKLEHTSRADCVRAVVEVARDRGTELVVVGLPLDAEGNIGHRATEVLAFVDELRTALGGVPVETVDETFSTDEAHARLKELGVKAARRKRLADSMSALVILERHLAGRSPRDRS